MLFRALFLAALLCSACHNPRADTQDAGHTRDAGPELDAAADPSADATTRDAAANPGEASVPDATAPNDAAEVEPGDVERDYCAPLARLLCERAEACGCGVLVPGGDLDATGCAARWTQKCLESYAPYVAAVEMGEAQVIKEHAVECVALIDSLTPGCEQPRGVVSFALCKPVVVSSTAIGAKCGGVPICAGGDGLCKEGTCVARAEKDAKCNTEYDCASGLVCVAGTCREPAKATTGCEEDNACAPPLRCVSHKCAALREEGQACNETFECAQGLLCSDKKCTPPAAICTADNTCGNRSSCGAPRACAPRSNADADCESDRDCANDLYCGSESKCIALPGLDAPCANGAMCGGGLACDPPGTEDPRCRVLPGDGKPCGLTSFGVFACAPDLGCLDGTCGPLPGEGATCTVDSRCASGFVCDFTAEGSFCVKPKPTGGTCQNEVVCGPSGHCGVDGLCAPDLPDGASCNPNLNECAHVCERDATFGFTCVDARVEGDACIFDEECPASLACRPQLEKATCIAEVCEVLR